MSGSYGYITLADLRSQLLQRLQDSTGSFTSTSEANVYINEALRVLNAQTLQWNTVYDLNFGNGDTWKSLAGDGSPRERTVTDTDLYTQMEYMLMEPATGGTWTGTAMYNIGILQAALQYRRDELLLLSAANTGRLMPSSPVLSVTTLLPDSTLDVLRVRWLPIDSTPIYDNTPTAAQIAAISAQSSYLANILAAGPTSDAVLSTQIEGITQGLQSVNIQLGTGVIPTATSMPYTLGREDVTTAIAFSPTATIAPGAPESWLITSNPPLSFDVNRPPNQPGTWDLLVSFAGLQLAPPATTIFGLPNDWCWVAMYGALYDVLSTSPEGRDSARAQYCLQRYEQGKKAIQIMPWLLEASVASISVDTPSVTEMDAWLQDWEDRQPAGDPLIVVGAVDYVALAPFNTTTNSVQAVLKVIQNAPIPTSDGDYIQLAKDGVDAVLNYAQHLASFKMGGQDFALTVPLFEQFESYCRKKNAQYAALGTFRPQMVMQGNRRDDFDPRFLPQEENAKQTR